MTTVRAKDPDANETYAIDFTEDLILPALREFDVAEGTIARAQLDTGWYYEAQTAGRTGRHYPHAWPREDGITVVDGSVVWVCRHPTTETVPSVQSVTWTLPAGLTLASQSESGRLAILTVSGGTDGEDYDVLCRMTPSIGNVDEKTITIPVRSQ